MKPCSSHDWRDARYIGQLVYNWSVAPMISPGAPTHAEDSAPAREMRYGRRYVCNNTGCTAEVTPRHDANWKVTEKQK